MSSASQLAALAGGRPAGGRLAAGFCYVFADLPEPLASEPVDHHDVVLAVPHSFGWRHDAPVTLRDLAGEPMVWLRRHSAPHYVDLLVTEATSGGLSPNVVQEADDETTLLSLVAAGIGIGFVNSANAHRRPPLVDFLPIAGMNVTLALHIAWNRTHRSQALERFILEATGPPTSPAVGGDSPRAGVRGTSEQDPAVRPARSGDDEAPR
jgi:DNA-binding transcriptional LysR family regulator